MQSSEPEPLLAHANLQPPPVRTPTQLCLAHATEIGLQFANVVYCLDGLIRRATHLQRDAHGALSMNARDFALRAKGHLEETVRLLEAARETLDARAEAELAQAVVEGAR